MATKGNFKNQLIHLVSWILRYGVSNYYKTRNRKMFDVPLDTRFLPEDSSITDSSNLETYTSLCGTAATDSTIFNKFRSARIMVEDLDHVSVEQANSYLDEILKYGVWNSESTRTFHHIDSIGQPNKIKFKNVGIFSPTLFRYLKVYLDLRALFGPIKDFKLAEIGIGFGGQASLIHLLDKPISYSFYDLPPVLALASKFFDGLEIKGDFKFIDGRYPEESTPDLLISNYAFSELSPKVQDAYLQRVILNSTRGYITWNSLSADQLGGYSLANLVRVIPNSQIIPEKPNTSTNNAVIVWGAK